MPMDRDDLVGGGWDRAPRMKVPRWWLDELERLVTAWLENVGGEKRTLVELASDVSRKARRTPEWTHGTISKCRDGKLVTWDVVEALCDFFGVLPYPVYYPRSLDEGRKLARDNVKEHRVQRRSELDQALGSLAGQSGKDQGAAVRSGNEQGQQNDRKGAKRGRARRLDGHRTPPRST